MVGWKKVDEKCVEDERDEVGSENSHKSEPAALGPLTVDPNP